MLQVKMDGGNRQGVSVMWLGWRHQGSLKQNVFVMKLRVEFTLEFKSSIVTTWNLDF